ncbi:hypothetical protein DPMN_007858 [Dreissena polymorpha]|uniref:Uncharacterized protein n=1 Tax=Dreissena polymorpha TaxID=45954 RepID=A0A9D4RYL9_DREPO|nr:hypothetical protein DPMN_007858 [Dreissena polymorpha]
MLSGRMIALVHVTGGVWDEGSQTMIVPVRECERVWVQNQDYPKSARVWIYVHLVFRHSATAILRRKMHYRYGDEHRACILAYAKHWFLK